VQFYGVVPGVAPEDFSVAGAHNAGHITCNTESNIKIAQTFLRSGIWCEISYNAQPWLRWQWKVIVNYCMVSAMTTLLIICINVIQE
jgi:hypothetical protein